MFKLKTGYFVSGIITGLILLITFVTSLPDGKLHIVVCDVGQGDSLYVRFPNGQDMLVDGGPNEKVLTCLSRYMPFWDRNLDLVFLTHPQQDHMAGLVSVLSRFAVSRVVRSDIGNETEGFKKIQKLIADKKIPQKLVSKGEIIDISGSILTVIWPSVEELARFHPQGSSSVLGAVSSTNVNDASLVLHLSYGSFDAMLPGDADSHVNGQAFAGVRPADGTVEFLKVPHHGSKTALSEQAFLQFRHFVPSRSIAAISVGKNSYGHPDKELMEKLVSMGFSIIRTDEKGDIEVVTDGKTWEVKKE